MVADRESLKALNIRDVPADVRAKFRAWCAVRDQSMRNVTIALLTELLTAEYIIDIDEYEDGSIEISRPIKPSALLK